MTTVKSVIGADLAFGVSGEDVARLMPEEPWKGASSQDQVAYRALVSQWFSEGLSSRVLKERVGVDRAGALAHMTALIRTFDLGHSEKKDAVAALMFEWFELELVES